MKALSSMVNATQVEADLDPFWVGTVNVTISLRCEGCLEKSEVLWVQKERVMWSISGFYQEVIAGDVAGIWQTYGLEMRRSQIKELNRFVFLSSLWR